MNHTNIEWVKNPDGTQGYTWNPTTGCLNGCPYCYAKRLAEGRLKPLYLANKNVAPLVEGWYHDFGKEGYVDSRYDAPFYPRFWPERLKEPYLVKKPRGIFTVDMGELFGDWIPQEWQDNIFHVIQKNPQHRFYLLTKQPQNLSKFSPFPENCWVGVTATDIEMADAALNILVYKVDATIKYLSFEPLLGSIGNSLDGFLGSNGGVNWVIIGAQTKPYKPPIIEWVEEIVQACDKTGIPVFLKDNLRPLLEEDGLNPLYWANIHNDERGHERADDELRQERPE